MMSQAGSLASISPSLTGRDQLNLLARLQLVANLTLAASEVAFLLLHWVCKASKHDLIATTLSR